MSNMADNCTPPPNPAPTNNQEELVRLKLPSESGGSCHQAYQGSPSHNSQQALFAQTLPTVSATPTSFMVYTGVMSQPPPNQITYSSSGQMQVQQGNFMGFQGPMQQQGPIQQHVSYQTSGSIQQPGSFQPGILQHGSLQPGSLQQQQPVYSTVYQTEGCFFPSQPQVFWTQSNVANSEASVGGQRSSSSKQLLVQQQQQQQQLQQQQQQGRGRTPTPAVAPNFQSKGGQRIQIHHHHHN